MRATTLFGLTFVLLGCGTESAIPAPSVETTPEEETNAPEVETPYAIHEWGFIAHHYADEEGDLLTSGTAPAAEHRPSFGHGNGRGGGKPVIYVHLQGEGNIARFTASLSTAGAFLEEWPHSAGSTPTNLTWEVEARQGSCSASDRYPVAADSHCTGIADHYCEAAELARYETQDAACLSVGGEQWNHLFYRAQIPGDLPLRVSKSEDVFTVQNSGALPGRLMRIRRATEATETRVALFAAPAIGESLALPAPDQAAAAGIAALTAELSALGMSDDEVGAFMTAWQPELFGDTTERHQVQMVGSPPYDLRSKVDALIYFLPSATVDAMVPFAFTPPPAEVRRAVLVRIDLGPGAPQGTIGLGNLGNIGHSGRSDNGYGNGQRRTTPRVRVRMGPVTVEGNLIPEVARRVMRRYASQLRRCGEQHPAPGSETQLDVQMVVGMNGSVQSVSVENGTSELRGCVEGALRHWNFPAPESGVARLSTSIQLEFPE